jgi:site-specific DNA-methyltransferase (adenine-specific)
MNAEQRKQAVLKVKLETAWSNRRIAELFGVDEKSVRNDLGTAELSAVDLPAATIGKDGKRRTSRPKTTFNKNSRETQKTLDALVNLNDDDLPNRPLDSSEIAKIANGKEYKRQREELANSFTETEPDVRWNVYHADISTWIAPRQYDFIITDPPYPKEYLNLYETLAIKAKTWLKPGGLLVAMCGQSYLSEIFTMMTKHMTYYWTACYLTPHQPTPLRQRNVNTTWKPLLMFANGNYTGKIFGDVYKSDHNEKAMHDWQQSESGMLAIMKQLCFPGQYILDPFVGSGTTGIAALEHGCLFDGLDVDIESVNIAKGRLNDTKKA